MVGRNALSFADSAPDTELLGAPASVGNRRGNFIEGGAPRAVSVVTTEAESLEAGRILGRALVDAFTPQLPALVLVYGTINHEQSETLLGLREILGSSVPLVGCSTQGIVCNDELMEEGFILGAMGLGGGGIRARTALVREVEANCRAKGAELARQLASGETEEPTVMVVFYDPACAADISEFLAGIRTEVSCPVFGAGASHRWGPAVGTYQYFDTEALERAAVAFSLAGPFELEIGLCGGTASTGLVMTVTRADGNRLLELDGRPAIQIFREATGLEPDEPLVPEHFASLAIAVQAPPLEHETESAANSLPYWLRSATGLDFASGAVLVQARIAQGSQVVLHHRTVHAVREGARRMGEQLASRLSGENEPWAVLGFECGARTQPFLGPEETLQEHRELRRLLGSGIPWLGMLAWGEIAPFGDGLAFHNYTYPLALFVRRKV